jgi:hypothetical protein
MPRDHEYPSGHKTPKEKQQKVLDRLAEYGPYGLTSREMAQISTPGDVSAVNGWGSCFTVLRQEKQIVALQERREDHHVYVMPQWLMGRDTWPGYRHRGHCATCTCEEEK